MLQICYQNDRSDTKILTHLAIFPQTALWVQFNEKQVFAQGWHPRRTRWTSCEIDFASAKKISTGSLHWDCCALTETRHCHVRGCIVTMHDPFTTALRNHLVTELCTPAYSAGACNGLDSVGKMKLVSRVWFCPLIYGPIIVMPCRCQFCN